MKKLRVRSELLLPDGTVVPVRDFDGNLVIDPAEWAKYQQSMMARVGETVSEQLRLHPELRAAWGIREDQNRMTMEELVTIDCTAAK